MRRRFVPGNVCDLQHVTNARERVPVEGCRARGPRTAPAARAIFRGLFASYSYRLDRKRTGSAVAAPFRSGNVCDRNTSRTRERVPSRVPGGVPATLSRPRRARFSGGVRLLFVPSRSKTHWVCRCGAVSFRERFVDSQHVTNARAGPVEGARWGPRTRARGRAIFRGCLASYSYRLDRKRTGSAVAAPFRSGNVCVPTTSRTRERVPSRVPGGVPGTAPRPRGFSGGCSPLIRTVSIENALGLPLRPPFRSGERLRSQHVTNARAGPVEGARLVHRTAPRPRDLTGVIASYSYPVSIENALGLPLRRRFVPGTFAIATRHERASKVPSRCCPVGVPALRPGRAIFRGCSPLIRTVSIENALGLPLRRRFVPGTFAIATRHERASGSRRGCPVGSPHCAPAARFSGGCSPLIRTVSIENALGLPLRRRFVPGTFAIATRHERASGSRRGCPVGSPHCAPAARFSGGSG